MANDDSNNWIYAGGLPYELTEGDIICVFSQYGEIADISLSRDKDTGKSRGFCFMKYEDPRSCELAIDNFNGVTVLGRKIKVSVSSKRPQETSSHSQRQLSPLIRRDPLNSRLNENSSSPVNKRNLIHDHRNSPRHHNNSSPSPRRHNFSPKPRERSPDYRQAKDRATNRDSSPAIQRAINSNHGHRLSHREDRYHRNTDRSSVPHRSRSRSIRRDRSPVRRHSPKRHRSPKRYHSPKRHQSPTRHYTSRRYHSPERHHSPRRHDSPRRRDSPRRYNSSSRPHHSPSSDKRQDSISRRKLESSPDHHKHSSRRHHHKRSSSRDRHRNHRRSSKERRVTHN